jgi:hypothetical protein
MAQQSSNGNRPKLSEKGLLTPGNCVVALQVCHRKVGFEEIANRNHRTAPQLKLTSILSHLLRHSYQTLGNTSLPPSLRTSPGTSRPGFQGFGLDFSSRACRPTPEFRPISLATHAAHTAKCQGSSASSVPSFRVRYSRVSSRGPWSATTSPDGLDARAFCRRDARL